MEALSAGGQHRLDCPANGRSELWWHCVTDLASNLDAAALECEGVGEGLEASSLAMGDGPIGLWMEVPALFRLERLGPNRECWAVPPQLPEYVGRVRLLPCPAIR